METLDRSLILQLKDCFVEFIDSEFEVFHLENFIMDILMFILETFRVEEVSIYTYQERNQQFELAGLTSVQVNEAGSQATIQKGPLKDLMNGDKFLQKKPMPRGLENYDFLIKVMKKNEMTGFLAIKDKFGSKMNQLTAEGCKRIGNAYGTYLGKVQKLTNIILEEKRYKQLYKVTERFHSSLNMDNLLMRIINSLQEVYPEFSYSLLLSQDNHNHFNLPIRDLNYDNENILAMEAYVTGTVQFENSLQQQPTLYAPLKGRQGVYGVLVVIAPNMLAFLKNEIEFITLLANEAGSALENAQLYQQSRKLIADLQLINETSHCLNANLRLSETIHYMSKQITQSFGAQEVGFLLYSPIENSDKILPGSTAFFSLKHAQEYIIYLKEKIEKENEALFIGDLHFSNQDEQMIYRSIIAIPMDLSEHLKGIAIVMHQEPYFFSFETFKLLQSLIHHSTLAFTNSMLREELEKMIITDHLTKLHSRNYLDEKINRSMNEDEQGTFILIDIDDFKKVNDSFGHQVGDEVLIQVAKLIRSNIRENDVGARWGGEELAIYLPKISLSAGVAIAKRLVERVAENSNPHVTVSCGVSYWNKDHTDTYNYLFKRADEALYVAKGTGKNKVVTQEDGIKAC
ncbi:sensor domain-containing diguanylate cyclase [Bacillus sp. EB600]|uniref:sensor domain-containing diguanylate cyclase n=1 Tax=Bacillus sp. EB600 TaxID=2806345 RepID=UPI00210AD315|nr:diguanylate cyclase [Bacillus sp. EB600]MCQ6278386.1 GGDEF domain-containing protein [Bacillus sp. EB600]